MAGPVPGVKPTRPRRRSALCRFRHPGYTAGPDPPATHGRASPGADARQGPGCAAAPASSPTVADADKSKSAPLPWLLLTGLLGVFAVGVPQAGPPTGAPAKKEEKKDADPPLVR